LPKNVTARNGSAYLPTLDGWRAIAILAVIFHHDSLHVIGRFSTEWLYLYGGTGVDVFFAISGILICSRLLDEEVILGRIDIKKFYIRRAFRILPPALLYLCVLAVLSKLAALAVTSREILGSIFFCMNYPHLLGVDGNAAKYYAQHFWSLAVEEHFYILLPALLVFTPRRYRVGVLGILAFLVSVNRAIVLSSRPWSHILFHTEIRLDALLAPAIFAVIASTAKGRTFFKSWLRFWPALLIITLCILPFGDGTALRATFIAWIMPCIVLGSVLNPSNIFGKFLELPVLRYVGRISYSIYLWQQLFFTGHFGREAHQLGWAQSWPLRLLLTFACAIASYHLLERPLVRVGHKLAQTTTHARGDLGRGSSPKRSLEFTADVQPVDPIP
jgi:peptidoglycan/LPS O-acetylase OafA/YrhL